MKTQIVTVSNREPRESYYIFSAFKESLRRFAITPTILGWQEPWGGLMTKPRRLRKWLREGRQSSDRLIVCDAWDIIFAAHPHGIIDRYDALFPGRIVFNAERNCFPRGDLAPQFDEIAATNGVTTPWKYLNSGFMVGEPAAILALLESMNIDAIPDDHQLPTGGWFNPNDQEHYAIAFLAQPVPMALDYETELCMACHGSELSELDFGDRIVNKITGTVPGAFHLNGSAKNTVQPALLAHLNL